jgi:hypothetical protein
MDQDRRVTERVDKQVIRGASADSPLNLLVHLFKASARQRIGRHPQVIAGDKPLYQIQGLTVPACGF